MHRLVIADDDEDVRLLLRVVLGHERDFKIVGEAATPHDAISMAAEHQPTAIIIDHEFRGYSTGTEAAPTIREQCPNTLIVMFSAYDALRSERKGSDFVDAFILKTDITALPAALRSLIEKH
jgi:DNA-binding NarL/FixJ family response regulator